MFGRNDALYEFYTFIIVCACIFLYTLISSLDILIYFYYNTKSAITIFIFAWYNGVMVKKSIKKKNAKKFPLGVVFEVVLLVVAIVGLGFLFVRKINQPADYIVETNAFFAPFEFYEGRKIVGVDIDIINRVAEKMGKKIEVKDVEFDVIIDNVEAGKIADAGAAGLTITPARSSKVNFSIPYYTSIQYVIFAKDSAPEIRGNHVVWEALKNFRLGSQMGSTGYLFASDEVDSGVLAGSGTEIKGFDSHQLAADAVLAHIVDYAIADELVAQMIVSKNPELMALPLCYTGPSIAEDYPVEESYAIAVNKEKTELLEAFNEVLAEMLTEDSEGKTEIDRLVLKYTGF